MLFQILLGLPLLPPCVLAHFMLSYPPALKNSSPNPSTTLDVSPCGLNSTTPLFNNLTSPTTTLSTSSFPLYVSTQEDHQWWLFRATTDKAPPFRWTNLLPVVEQLAEGSFCIPDLSLPKSFVDREAILQVVQQHDGGLGYQCATISFVADMPEMMPPPCENATNLGAIITDSDDLPPMHNGSTDSYDGSMTGSMDMGNMNGTPTKNPHNHSGTGASGTGKTATSAGQRILASAGIAGFIALLFWVGM